MKNSLFKKLKGYHKAPRARFLLLTEKKLSHEEFLLYELGVAISDWDEEHSDTYGTFLASNRELAEVLGLKSDTTIARHKKKLVRKGLFIRYEDGRIAPKGYEKWLLRKHNTSAITPVVNAKKQLLTANKPELQSQLPSLSLVSFNDGVNSIPKDKLEELSDGDMNKIVELTK